MTAIHSIFSTHLGDDESSLLDWFDNHFEEDSRQNLNTSSPEVPSAPETEVSPVNSDKGNGSRISFFAKVTQPQNGVSKVDQILPKKKKRKNKNAANATHKQPKRKMRKSPKSNKVVCCCDRAFAHLFACYL